MLYQFEISLSDVDRDIYKTLTFRINQHPSEATPYLLTRALAYVLSHQDNLEFSPAGLGDPDAPALLAKSPTGVVELWIEIGNPSAKRLHKASKASEKVIVYTYKNAEALIKEISENKVHRAEDIEIHALDPQFLQNLSEELKKNCRWSVLHQGGHIDIGTGEKNFSTIITSRQASA